MEQQEKQFEIDLVDLFYYLKKKILIIIAAVLAVGVMGYVYSAMFVTPQYTAEARMYILNRGNENGVLTQDFQISTYMLYDYEVLITGKNVTKEVVEQLNLDMTPAALGAKIKVTSPENTRVLQVSINDADPQLAAAIANKVCEVAANQIRDILSSPDAVHLVYGADVPRSPSSPRVMQNSILAAVLGLIGSVGILVIIYVADDSITSEEDVERYLGVSVLGVIPESTDVNMMSGDKSAKKAGILRKAEKK